MRSFLVRCDEVPRLGSRLGPCPSPPLRLVSSGPLPLVQQTTRYSRHPGGMAISLGIRSSVSVKPRTAEGRLAHPYGHADRTADESASSKCSAVRRPSYPCDVPTRRPLRNRTRDKDR